uniref:Uncharacterized protein n=1 Tax=Ananas comosus var. bracteatus TaxID=296719 RepID=A0A6V7PPN9_ANACO|nr:unnamed protein product [Ananas comosus var. bracteatus]
MNASASPSSSRFLLFVSFFVVVVLFLALPVTSISAPMADEHAKLPLAEAEEAKVQIVYVDRPRRGSRGVSHPHPRRLRRLRRGCELPLHARGERLRREAHSEAGRGIAEATRCSSGGAGQELPAAWAQHCHHRISII